MPITRRAQSFSWNASTREEQAVMERFGVADRRLFHMHPGFSAPAETPAVSRGELGLPQGAFVFAVVGGRLDDEVDGRFLNLLESIVENPNAHIAMMGRFDRFDTVMGVRPRLAGRVSFLGYRKDLLATLRICNAFLNPNRTGGGRSGAYAQYAGLPVLSLRYGDVASTIGEENGCISYAEIAERAARLMTDPSERVQGRAAALARAGEVIGVKRLVTRIYSEMNIAA
jgi:glycosyltransferase involved in cell wall biosynthesis